MINLDYVVYMVKLPGSINATTRIDATGFASIYINSQLSPQARRRAFRHEIKHLLHNDFDNDKPIAEVEESAQ